MSETWGLRLLQDYEERKKKESTGKKGNAEKMEYAEVLSFYSSTLSQLMALLQVQLIQKVT